MYQKVVVPLDGSKLAEIALPHLEEIARGCSIPDILLVSVTEPVKGRIIRDNVYEPFVPEGPVSEGVPHTSTSQFYVIFRQHAHSIQEIPMRLGKMAKTASDYLCRMAEDLEAKGFRATATILVGEPAAEIVRYVNAQRADLIVMASMGKSKMSAFDRWDMSRIAEKVIKQTHVPVLLVKPGTDFKESRPKRRGVAL